jgi:hypothetical protein
MIRSKQQKIACIPSVACIPSGVVHRHGQIKSKERGAIMYAAAPPFIIVHTNFQPSGPEATKAPSDGKHELHQVIHILPLPPRAAAIIHTPSWLQYIGFDDNSDEKVQQLQETRQGGG